MGTYIFFTLMYYIHMYRNFEPRRSSPHLEADIIRLLALGFLALSFKMQPDSDSSFVCTHFPDLEYFQNQRWNRIPAFKQQ